MKLEGLIKYHDKQKIKEEYEGKIKDTREQLKRQIEKSSPDDLIIIDYYETKIQALEKLLGEEK